jgi:peptidoglycan-associated lipoprotein
MLRLGQQQFKPQGWAPNFAQTVCGRALGGENMQSTIWNKMAVLLVILTLVLSASCSKKAVTTDDGIVAADDDGKVMESSTMQSEYPDSADSSREVETAAMSDVVLQQNVYFEFDKATLTPEAREILVKNGEWLQMNRDVAITIEGHCDERGTNEYNLALGDRRAETVKTFLADLGIHPSRVNTISYGEEKPADPSHSESAWSKNRRAYFLIK